MCGRFTLRTSIKAIVEAFGLIDAPELKPRYNIAPTQQIAAIRLDPGTGTRRLSLLHWGLIPSWADDPLNQVRGVASKAARLFAPLPNRKAPSQRRELPQVRNSLVHG
jgi:putative SOS response-associated peptidase YedK